ncbi:MAG: hypothetical protein JJU11_17765 [Candidatus Sumerlaeia bacterium]|nr:hypothetical protein [Candidatus Sumerlaeia bacterium]
MKYPQLITFLKGVNERLDTIGVIFIASISILLVLSYPRYSPIFMSIYICTITLATLIRLTAGIVLREREKSMINCSFQGKFKCNSGAVLFFGEASADIEFQHVMHEPREIGYHVDVVESEFFELKLTGFKVERAGRQIGLLIETGLLFVGDRDVLRQLKSSDKHRELVHTYFGRPLDKNIEPIEKLIGESGLIEGILVDVGQAGLYDVELNEETDTLRLYPTPEVDPDYE